MALLEFVNAVGNVVAEMSNELESFKDRAKKWHELADKLDAAMYDVQKALEIKDQLAKDVQELEKKKAGIEEMLGGLASFAERLKK